MWGIGSADSKRAGLLPPFVVRVIECPDIRRLKFWCVTRRAPHLASLGTPRTAHAEPAACPNDFARHPRYTGRDLGSDPTRAKLGRTVNTLTLMGSSQINRGGLSTMPPYCSACHRRTLSILPVRRGRYTKTLPATHKLSLDNSPLVCRSRPCCPMDVSCEPSLEPPDTAQIPLRGEWWSAAALDRSIGQPFAAVVLAPTQSLTPKIGIPNRPCRRRGGLIIGWGDKTAVSARPVAWSDTSDAGGVEMAQGPIIRQIAASRCPVLPFGIFGPVMSRAYVL